MQQDHDNTYPLPNSGGQPAVPSNDWSASTPATPPAEPAAATPAQSQPMAAPTPAEPPAAPPVIPDTEAQQMASADYNGGVAPNPAQPTMPEPHPTEVNPPQAVPAPGNTLDLSGQPQQPVAPQVPAPTIAASDIATQAAPNQYGITPAQPVLADVPGANPAAPMAAPGAGVSPTGLPTDLNDAMLDPNLMAATAPKPRRSPVKIILIILGVIVGLFIVISLVVYVTGRTTRKPAIELNDATTSSQSNQASSQDASLPAGFVKIDKDCYSFGAYQTNTIPSGGACNFSATEGGYKIAITPVTDSYQDLDAFANSVKGSLSTPTTTSVTLDGINAQKIVYVLNGKNQVKYLVLVNGKNYKYNDKAVTGFTIDMDYSTPNAQNNANTLVSTWHWK